MRLAVKGSGNWDGKKKFIFTNFQLKFSIGNKPNGASNACDLSLIKITDILKFLLLLLLFLAVLGLRCCTWASSSCLAVRGLLIAMASPVVEHRLQACGLSSCGSRAQLLCGMWDLPRPGLEPVSPALAGGFLTTVPPGKPITDISTSRYFFWQIF